MWLLKGRSLMAIRCKLRLWQQLRRVLGNVRLSSRLALGFGLVLTLLVGITVTALLSMNEMADRMRVIVEENNRRAALASDMSQAVNEAAIAVRNLVIIAWVDELPAEMLRVRQALQRYDKSKMALAALLERESPQSPVQQQMKAIDKVEPDARHVTLEAGDLAMHGKKEDATTMVALDLRMAQAGWQDEIARLVALEA